MSEFSAPHAGGTLARPSALVRYLAVAYTLLVGYASLYPFSPWRGLAGSAFSFLLEPWPRYTMPDVVLNVLGYFPLGLLLTLTAMAWVAPRWAALLATLASVAVSLFLEAVQSYLPMRVASNLDLLSNGLGAMLGALIAYISAQRGLLSGRFYQLRAHLFLPGTAVDLGLVVVFLWLFTQLYPTVWLFGSGDLRPFVASSHMSYHPASYRWIEAGVTALSMTGICLLVASLAQPRRSVAATLLALIATALLVKTAAALTLFKSADASLWLTPGALLGIPTAVVLLLVLAWCPSALLPWLAATALALSVLLVNVAPENPYLVASIQTWQRGHFLSFNGTTRLVHGLWPFLAIAYLAWWGWHHTSQKAKLAPDSNI
ncbi:MAG: teicoplanin resistance protein VanZ, partial [Proteobacteria bacterium]